MKEKADFSHFAVLDMRIGRVVKVEEADTRKPLYRMTVDFGEEIGTKVSIAGYAEYPKEELLGRLVVAVINFEPKRMGPEVSEIFILGAVNEEGKAVYLAPESDVPPGTVVV
ncbi:MAG: protein secretion chaperonin CsaA [Candidatus Eisenbacteria bacterium]